MVFVLSSDGQPLDPCCGAGAAAADKRAGGGIPALPIHHHPARPPRLTRSTRIIIDGKEIDPATLNSAPAKPAPQIRVTAPAGSTLDGMFSNEACVTGNLELEGARVQASSTANVGLNVAGPLKARVSSGAQVRASGRMCSVDARASSSGNILVSGMFGSVEAEASSSGSVQTIGPVTSDYDARASSSGSVMHSGGVAGRVRRSQSSVGTVHIG